MCRETFWIMKEEMIYVVLVPGPDASWGTAHATVAV